MGVEQPGFPGMKEYIFSTTVKTVAPGNYLVTGDIKTQVLRIKAEQGKDIWLFGGASLTTSLINLGLVDEIALAVHPVLLGGGKPLFSGITKGKIWSCYPANCMTRAWWCLRTSSWKHSHAK